MDDSAFIIASCITIIITIIICSLLCVNSNSVEQIKDRDCILYNKEIYCKEEK